MDKTMHMICNAHIDPVWQWEWEEGVAAAVSTFRAAAEFCETYDGFIFNHNEALLYEWVEEYEPQLFERIKKLVAQGKWHIMGGWYIQPDCVMPSGESFIRQILLGQNFFKEKFHVCPTTAVNFDSFGHTRGLVQILAKSGYDSYIFMRPDKSDYEIKQGLDFIWEGFDGSKVICHKIMPGYNSLLGRVQEKIDASFKHFAGKQIGLMPWGVGNHGGGPSRADLAVIADVQKTDCEFNLKHSTPEEYFKELRQSETELFTVNKSIVPCFVGCYTSQIRIKTKHRELENLLYMTEKMATAAEINGLMQYPKGKIDQATKYLAIAEFHDILPGTSVQPVEEYALNIMGNGINLLSEIRAKAFFALASGQPKADDGEYPILIYNPHPFAVRGVFECEFMLADQNWEDYFSVPVVYQNDVKIPSQIEKENSTFNLDWRKRVAFEAELAPSTMNRFNCRIIKMEKKPAHNLTFQNDKYIIDNGSMYLEINYKTGLVDRYQVNGQDLLLENALKQIVFADKPDSWLMDTDSFDVMQGEFELMTPEEGARFCGIDKAGSIRVVEDGDVRTVIEAYFKYKTSTLCLTYKIPKSGSEFQVNVRVYWNEKDKMLKLSVPTSIAYGQYIGQTAFGIDNLQVDGTEAVAHKWTATYNENSAVCVINDGTYGSSFKNGEIMLNLLRSAGYCTHPITDRNILPEDRFYPRMEQGERSFSFWITGGDKDVLRTIDRISTVHNEKPYALSFFPSGEGESVMPSVIIDSETIQLSAFKKAERESGYILRLYEPNGERVNTKINVPLFNIEYDVTMSPFEVKTLLLDNNGVFAINLVEEKI